MQDYGFPPEFPEEEEDNDKSGKQIQTEEPIIKDKSKGKKVAIE